jgi:hypothetical protein
MSLRKRGSPPVITTVKFGAGLLMVSTADKKSARGMSGYVHDLEQSLPQ